MTFSGSPLFFNDGKQDRAADSERFGNAQLNGTISPNMHCSNCGKSLTTEQKFCSKCGTYIPQRIGTALPPSMLPYAGFWRRFLGWLIDYVLTVAIAAVSVELLVPRIADSQQTAAWMGFIIYFFLPLPYFVLMESSRLQATIGKLVVGVKVTDIEGNRISTARALWRFVARFLDGVTFGVGYAMAAFTQRRQGLHDKHAGTLVILRTVDASQVRSAPLAPASGGRTALVVAAVLISGPFSIAALAAIAIPAYLNYTIRAQVTEGLIAADSFKIAVAHAMSQGVDWNKNDSKSLAGDQPKGLHYVQAINVESGRIVIVYGVAANAEINGKTLAMAPGVNGNRDVVWICGRARIPDGVQVAIDNPAQYTTVADAYLPAACRQ